VKNNKKKQNSKLWNFGEKIISDIYIFLRQLLEISRIH